MTSCNILHPERTLDMSLAPQNFTGAESMANVLCEEGVEYVFLMTGGDIPLWQAIDQTDIRHILARSEASAAYMADGYSRTTGRPSIVYGQWGPGAANVASGL